MIGREVSFEEVMKTSQCWSWGDVRLQTVISCDVVWALLEIQQSSRWWKNSGNWSRFNKVSWWSTFL